MKDRAMENKIVLVKRKTRLEELVVRFNTASQAQFYIEHLGADFSDYIREDEVYRLAVSKAVQILEALGRVQVVDRAFLPNFIFGEKDLVVAVGQDGLVANTLKYLDSQVLVGVNPDPSRWDGVLLPFEAEDLAAVVPEVFKGRRRIKEVTMAKAQINDGQSIYAVNDLYIGQKTHVSSRYVLQLGSSVEQQSSSGIIVSTGLGATGWLRSVLTGAANIVGSISDHKIRIQSSKTPEWDSSTLHFSVREPFPTRNTGAELVFGKITESTPLRILSQMPENGVIFSDGIESDFLNFTSGLKAVITAAEKKGRLVV